MFCKQLCDGGCRLLKSVCLAEKPQYQHGISLLHDLKYRADFTHFAYSNPSAPKGGSLTLSTTHPIRNFSGAWGMGAGSAPGLHRTNDRLFVRSADELSAVYGLLADGVALSADRKSLFIRLNPAARWHDGAPITTRDVHFSYDALESFTTSAISKAYLDAWTVSCYGGSIIFPSTCRIRNVSCIGTSSAAPMTLPPYTNT